MKLICDNLTKAKVMIMCLRLSDITQQHFITKKNYLILHYRSVLLTPDVYTCFYSAVLIPMQLGVYVFISSLLSVLIFSFLTKCTWCVSSDRTNGDGSIGRWDPNLIEKLPNLLTRKRNQKDYYIVMKVTFGNAQYKTYVLRPKNRWSLML